ncbi:MAG: hypothetical protein KDJ46_02655 [Rhodobiaceae bacterium]|nr:hypothetical protein [Rhodobiaceae bacterium]
MNRFAKPVLAAGALALAVTLAAPQAEAGHRNGQIVAGAIIGLAAGAIIAGAVANSNSYGYGYGYYQGPVYQPYGYPAYGYPAYGAPVYVAPPPPRYYRHRPHHRHAPKQFWAPNG